jgi:WD40 repeat protein
MVHSEEDPRMFHHRLHFARATFMAMCAFCSFLGLFEHWGISPARADAPDSVLFAGRITPKNAAQVRELAHIDKDVYRIVWSTDGKEAAFIYWENPVEIVDAKSYKLIRKVGEGRRLIHFAFSRDAQIVAFCESSTQAEILNLGTGKSIELAVEIGHPRPEFSPDGKLLATGGYGRAARLWSVADGRLQATLDIGDTEGGLTPAFSPNGKIIAVGNRNSETKLFDVATGRLLQVLDKKCTQEIKFHPNGKILAAAYVDGSVGLWDVMDGSMLGMSKPVAQEIYTLDWSPKGEILATAGLHGRIVLWNPKDLSVLKELKGPEWVISLKFSPDGTRLLSAGGARFPPADRKIQVWGLPAK